jgi:catalase
MVDLLAHVDQDLATRVAAGIGVTFDSFANATARLKDGWQRFGATSLPGPRVTGLPGTAPELSIVANNKKDTIATRKVAVLVADGFHGDHVTAIRDALKKQGATAELIAPRLGEIRCGGGNPHQPERTLFNTNSVVYDALYLPGGAKSIAALQGDPRAREFITNAYRHGKAIAATTEGIDLLLASGVIPGGKPEAALPGKAGIVAERDPKDIKVTAKNFIAAIAEHRVFGRT